MTQPLRHEVGDGGNRAAVFHQLAEQSAKQKDREELREESRGALHERLRPVSEQRLARERCGEQGGGGRAEARSSRDRRAG
jgi:hypothetical protein